MRLMPTMAASARTISISLLHGASAGGPNQGARVGHYGQVVPANPDGQASDRPPQAQTPVILAFGLKPERFVGGEGRIDAVLEPPPADESDVLVEALASGIEANGYVIAVLPQWFPPEGALRLGMARSMLDTDRVAVHETALPPLAGAVLCSLASALGAHVPSAGVLASLLPEIEAELHVFTWLGSVSGLSAPAPTFGQHLASLGPKHRVRRLLVARAVRAQARRRRARCPAAGDRAAVADGHRAARGRHRVGFARRSTGRSAACPWPRSSRPRTGPRGGAPARSSRAWCSRSTSPSWPGSS